MKLTLPLAFFALPWLSLASPLAAQQSRTALPQLTPEQLQRSSWFSDVSRRLERAEYGFSASIGEEGVIAASNHAHGFQSRVTTRGLEVLPRENADGDTCEQWKLSLSTKSFGREGHVVELAAATMELASDRVELDHATILEWFVNDERGLEQGWTIAAAPRGEGRLWIGLEFSGDLSLRIDGGARSGVLVDAQGEARLHYSGLKVFDATGRELDASLVSRPEGVGISIDDTRAIYPLTVDPVLTGPAWAVLGDQQASFFGLSVASAGDVNGDGFSDVIVGAHQHDDAFDMNGRAYVYLGALGGLSSTPAWTVAGSRPFAYFGVSVATAGDVNGDGYSDVIVGAWGDENGQSQEGRAFVYMGSATGLSTTAAWIGEGNQVDASFGGSVATAGDVNGDGYSDVLVGAPGFDNGQANEGRAYMYLGSASGLATSAAWTAEGNQAGARFGASVSTAGDVTNDGYSDVLIGAPSMDDTFVDDGFAFLYRGSATGLEAAYAWSKSGDQTGAGMGSSVAAAGDVNGDGWADVILGEPHFDSLQTNAGRAYLLTGHPAQILHLNAWFPQGESSFANFGYAVATAGDVNADGYSDVIVGAPFFTNGQTEEGRIYVYLGSSAGLVTTAAWTAESNEPTAWFGVAVALAGDVNGDGRSDVIVGAPLFGETLPLQYSGRACVYYGASSGLATSAAWNTAPIQNTSFFGWSVATAGDVNGDGYSDVVVGAHNYETDQDQEGAAFLYLGSAFGLSTTESWSAEGNQVGASFGMRVGTAGDVNGDGYSDVIVSAYRFNNGQTDEGRVFVYLGSSAGLSFTPAWTAEGDQTQANFGWDAGSAGDVNGDGFGDVIVGAANYSNGQAFEGRAFVYLGSSTGLSATPHWTFENNQMSAWVGSSVATAGDVNRDGFSDVVVGAPGANGGNSGTGAAYVFLGSSSGLTLTTSWSVIGSSGARFGFSVATAGDVNADGYSDVIVGAPGVNGPLNPAQVGRAFVYPGTSSGLSVFPVASLTDSTFSAFGHSVAMAGDVNSDGYSDVIVGAPVAWAQLPNDGSALVYLGSSSGVAAAPAWTAAGAGSHVFMGFSVGTAGDVNGDGYDDVVVGEPGNGDFPVNDCRARVFLGNEGRGGWTRAARQRRADGSAPIDLLGKSIDNQRFRIGLSFVRPFAGFDWATGRPPDARLQWEVKHVGTSLSGNSIQSGMAEPIADLPMSFEEFAEFQRAGGPRQIIASGPYHWHARVRTNNPLFPVTRWVSIPRNNVTEAKLRVIPTTPGIGVPH